jgi:branched-chain amino acid transport system permease protein
VSSSALTAERVIAAALGAALVAVPLSGSAYLTNLSIVVALHALPAIGLGLLMGYTGQISIGHAAFYGLGAYGSALLALRLGVNPWLAIAVASALVGLVAWALGWVIFRLRGHHLAVATLALGIIVYVGFVEMRGLTGGPNGLSGIPPLSLAGLPLDGDFRFYPVAWAVCLLGAAAAARLIDAPLGLAMRAIRESERATEALGTDVVALKRGILVVSAVYAAVAGGLYAHYIGFVSPQPFGVGFSIRLIVMVAVGGFASVWGALFGAAFVTVIGEPLQKLGHFDVIAYGLLLVVVMVFFPQGVLRALGRWRGARAAAT